MDWNEKTLSWEPEENGDDEDTPNRVSENDKESLIKFFIDLMFKPWWEKNQKQKYWTKNNSDDNFKFPYGISLILAAIIRAGVPFSYGVVPIYNTDTFIVSVLIIASVIDVIFVVTVNDDRKSRWDLVRLLYDLVVILYFVMVYLSLYP